MTEQTVYMVGVPIILAMIAIGRLEEPGHFAGILLARRLPA